MTACQDLGCVVLLLFPLLRKPGQHLGAYGQGGASKEINMHVAHGDDALLEGGGNVCTRTRTYAHTHTHGWEHFWHQAWRMHVLNN